MNKDLQNLVKLQEIDMRIYELRQSKKEYPLEVEKLRETNQKAIDAVAAIEKKATDIANERRAIEDQIVQARAALVRSEEPRLPVIALLW